MLEKPINLNKSTSKVIEPLEAVRGLAALYVFIGHVANVYYGKPAWSILFSFTAEVVIAFFLLSGFVVRWSTRDDVGLRVYAKKRFRRLYPLYALSLILAYAFASLEAGQWADPQWGRLLGNLLMMQDFGLGRPGVWVDQYYNLVLWSLSYEAWFYALFFLQLGHSQRLQNFFAIGLCAAGFIVHYIWPNQVSYFAIYFVIWWAGAAMATRVLQNGQPEWRDCLLWAGVMICGAVLWLPALSEVGIDQGAGLYPLIDIRRFVAGAVILVCATWIARSWQGSPGKLFQASLGKFSWLGTYSYALYISHFPLVHAFYVLMPGIPAAVGLPILTALAMALAWLLEGKVQPLFNRILR